jgi:hypothetical protein
MVIIRFEPGRRAPVAGVFVLVGHWGEPTGFTYECQAGDRLPRAVLEVPAGGALWYVLREEAPELRMAA